MGSQLDKYPSDNETINLTSPLLLLIFGDVSSWATGECGSKVSQRERLALENNKRGRNSMAPDGKYLVGTVLLQFLLLKNVP